MARSPHSGGARSQRDPDAFPFKQLLVLGICRICEPIAFMSIFPYIYFMVQSFHMTTDGNRVALYAGLVTSVFAFAECLGAGFWGRMSDKFGRKPILLTGLLGTGLSMLVFGFSSNLAVALVARAIGGALNGNIGVLQTTVNEVVKVEAHQARAFAIMPTVWCLGAIIGSTLGGTFANPADSFPHLFPPGSIFDKFPYLLTNLVCTGVVILSLIVGILFLEETHEDLRHRRDVGLKIGDWILTRFRRATPGSEKNAVRRRRVSEESMTLIDEVLPDYRSTVSSPELSASAAQGLPPPAYRSIEGSPRSSCADQARFTDFPAIEEASLADANVPRKVQSGLLSAFTKQVMLNITGYGILAYHTISAEQLLPVLLSLPKSHTPPTLPFLFDGGFGMSTKAIGALLSVQGIIQMVATIVVFPIVNRRLGSLWTYRCVVLLYPLMYFLLPYISLAPDNLKLPLIYVALVWKVTSQAFAFPSSSIMLANSAPSSRVLGTLNGAAASVASGCRAFGPTVSGLLQSAGLSIGTLGLPWWVNVLVAGLGAAISMFMVEEKRRVFHSEKPPHDNDDEASDLHSADNSAYPYPPSTMIAAQPTNASCDNLLATPLSPLVTRLSLDGRRDSWPQYHDPHTPSSPPSSPIL